MAGLGWGLAGFVDDPVTDMVVYPQLNVLTPGWLVGIEMSQPGSYGPYFHSHGRWSFAANLDAHAAGKDGWCDPSLAVATQVGPLSLGAGATLGFIDEPTTPPADIHWGSVSVLHDVGDAVVGARWSGAGVSVDGNIGVGEYDDYVWRTDGISDTTLDILRHPYLRPSLRMTWPGKQLSWRAIASYECDHGKWPSHETWRKHTLSLNGGPIYRSKSLLVASRFTARTTIHEANMYWGTTLAAGMEWNTGPVTLRLGTDAGVSFTTSRGQTDYRGFTSSTYAGLGLRPVERLRLDFAPDMDNAANLRGWQLAASYEF
jgi:hypothetical protein